MAYNTGRLEADRSSPKLQAPPTTYQGQIQFQKTPQ